MSFRTFVLNYEKEEPTRVRLVQEGNGIRWVPRGVFMPGWKLDPYIDYITTIWDALHIPWKEDTESGENGE